MKLKFSVVLPLLAATTLSCGATFGATFTVTNTDDSGPGSLRQAITDANGSSGADTIVFAIPGDGQKTITITSTQLPDVVETVTIDGGNTGVVSNRVEISGGGGFCCGLAINSTNANGSEIRNLIINGFTSRAILAINTADITIRGCFLGLNAAGTAIVSTSGEAVESFNVSGLVIGGATPAERNVMSAGGGLVLALNGSSATVLGNFIGLNKDGTAPVGTPAVGVFIGNGSGTIGGTNPGEGNVIVAFTGVQFAGNPALGQSSGTVQGNLIGTNAAGDTAFNFGLGAGVAVTHATGVIISGRNVISGNGDGITINQSGVNGNHSDHTTVQGNFIGTAADGVTALGNSRSGIDNNCPDNTIGGTNPGEGNVIAFNGLAGVHHRGAINNLTEGNLIFSNGGLGIDLDFDGPTLNDNGDSDVGANNLQNFPRIAAVTVSGGNVAISGFLNSRPNTAYRLEFFANETADASGFGEGQTFLGSTDVTTDGVGNQAFDVGFAFAGTINAVTATATDPDGNTSEFSHAFGIKLQNISTRLKVLTGENVLIGGFIITGDDSKQVIVRAIGPSLGSAGLAGALGDTVLELHEADGTVVTNDNWKDDQQTELEATGIPPTNDLESAIVGTFLPGAYTAILSGKNGATGIALVEAYDLDQALGSILANISTRGFVDTGDNVLIGGFIVGPADTGFADILIRGIGPSLSAFGVANPLLNPFLELHDANGATLTTNDNWKDIQQTEIEATTIPPTDDNESAILQSLAPGAYTAILKGVDDTTGVGLVEIYNLPNAL